MEAVIKGQVYFRAIGEHKEAPAGGWCLFEVIFFGFLTPIQLFFIHLLKGISDIDGAPGCQREEVRAWAPANFYAERYFWAMGYLLP